MTDLDKKAFRGFFWLFAVMAALIFIPAGTLSYWRAWVYLAVFFSSSLAITLYLMKHDRRLLERRVRGGPGAENEKAQKIIMALVSAAFIALLVVPAFDHRFGWSRVPAAVALVGDALVALGYLAIFFVFKENSFAASTIVIDPDQKVIATGPYALVRHPMYAGSFFMLAGIPLALGSWWGLLVIVPLLPLLLWRLLDEEHLLAKSLPGYGGYKDKVRYRLVPFVW
jgi:protein-S-isoprenylcysteine O-methyltransferase Ste14